MDVVQVQGKVLGAKTRSKVIETEHAGCVTVCSINKIHVPIGTNATEFVTGVIATYAIPSPHPVTTGMRVEPLG